MNKNILKFFIPVAFCSVFIIYACKKSYLDVPNTGALDPSLVANILMGQNRHWSIQRKCPPCSAKVPVSAAGLAAILH